MDTKEDGRGGSGKRGRERVPVEGREDVSSRVSLLGCGRRDFSEGGGVGVRERPTVLGDIK